MFRIKDWLYTTTGGGSGRTAPGFPRPRWGVWIALGVGGAGLLAGLGYGGYRLAAGWIERRNTGRAQIFIGQQDFRRAHLLLEQAVQVNPDSVSARRALAEFYDLAGSPRAVERWREAGVLAPADDSLKLGRAASALRTGDLAELRLALAEVSGASRDGLNYHRLAAGLALAEGHATELAPHLEAMVRLEPDNVRSRYSLAALRLRSPQADEAGQARSELEELARGDQARIAATLALWQALPAGNAGALRALAARVLRKGILGAGAEGGFELIEHMKEQPHPSPDDAAALANWMVAQGYGREALLWLRVLDPAVLASPVVRMARVTAAVRLQDWALLRELLGDGAWGHVEKPVIERAFAARRQRERGNLVEARATFGEAIKLAVDSPGGLWMLARLGAVWVWPDESERVLWQIARSFPRDENAWRGLIARAEAERSSGRLLDVLQKRAATRPNDTAASADWLLLAVLLEKADPVAQRRARSALDTPDAPPAELAAGALLLAREGRNAEALQVLGRAGERLRSSPRAALVYRALLLQAGRAEEAKKWPGSAPEAKLLPEERALLSSATVRASEKG